MEWINVTDDLPDTGKAKSIEVLVRRQYRIAFDDSNHFSTDIFRFCNGMFNHKYGGFKLPKEYGITHWMYLPKPPKAIK